MATFPESWWKERPLVLGHRGASHDAPQNTLAAFRKAVEVGADGVELDVHLSRDGVPVVIHDAKVDATTDGSGSVSAMSLAELQSPLQVVYRLPPGSVSRGDLLTMADGGVMVAHSDAVDRRLLRFSADGMLVWERSYAGQLNGDVRLQRLGADIYVTAQSELGNDGDMTLYALSAANNRLTMLFRSGTRTPLPGGSWTAVLPDHLLINTGGGPLALLDPQAALMASGVR